MVNRRTTIFAVLGTLLMIGMAASIPVSASDASLSVDVEQDDDSGEVLVSVAETNETVNDETNETVNETSAISGANLTVQALGNATYAGSGTYVNATDENGTYTLPAPTETNESVEIDVTAEYDGATANATAILEPVEAEEGEGDESGNESDAFGQLVSNFVHDLQNSNETNDSPMGPLVATFVLQHNPGDPPEHAGPPEWLFNDSVEHTQGPPDHAGPDDDSDRGPPDNAGSNNDSDRGPPDHAGPGDGNESTQGPPDDRGPPHDDDDRDDS